MTSRHVPLTVGLAVAVGVLLGVLFPSPRPAHALTVSVQVNPGPTYAWLTTSWHGAGGALDWGHQNGGAYAANSVNYWRSWAFRTGASNPTQIGTISVETLSATCKTVRARYRDNNGAVLGDVKFVHTYWYGNSFFYLFGQGSWYYQSYAVAKIAADENQACKDAGLWTAPHLHEEPLSPFSPDTYNYNTINAWYTVTGIGNGQAQLTTFS